jgi:hypothetical protein
MAKKAPAGVHPVRVHLAPSPLEANLVVGFFEEKGIPARIEDPLTRQAFPGVDLHMDGEAGVGVLVSSDDEARARAALAEYRARPSLEEGERVEEE